MNPLETIKKLKGRSWSELKTRGGQAISVYGEQIGLGNRLPSDSDLRGLMSRPAFGGGDITSATMMARFYQLGDDAFFPAFRDLDDTTELFRDKFRGAGVANVLERSEKILDGKFDLLGYLSLEFGPPVDWHYEPISRKHIPLRHWKQYDELDTRETGDKKVVWELNRCQHFFTLGVAYKLTGDERYAEEFAVQIESWMAQNPPGMGINWLSSLEVAFRAISWIWALHMFRGAASLTPQLFAQILKFLYVHGRHLEKYLSTYFSPNTHLTGEALGLYYLGTQLRIFERAKTWREIGDRILIGELDRQILDDGVYFEQSTWYQRYTTDFYTHFVILRSLAEPVAADDETQTKLEIKLQLLHDFLMSITLPDGTTPIIGDDDGGKMLPHSAAAKSDFRGVLSTAAILFDRGDYKFVAGDFREETLWFFGRDGFSHFEKLRAHEPRRTSKFFPEGGYFAMRDGWSDTDNYLLVDCGQLGAIGCGHGHADALSIVTACGGRTTLIDPGTYTYHESTETRDFFRTSVAHNTLLVDERSQSEPGGKFSWKSEANVSIQSRISEERFDFFEAAHDGYGRLDSPTTHQRSILFLKNDYWIMRDFVQTNGTHDYALNYHFNKETKIEIEEAENGMLCVGEKATPARDGWRLFTFGDNGMWQQKESWMSDCYGRKINSPFVRYVSKSTGPQEFYSFFVPSATGLEKPEVFETFIAGGRAFVVKYRGYWDLFVFADPDQIVRTDIFNSNFRFLWARLSPGDQLPDEYVMVGGTNFTLGNREVINFPNELKFAVARRLGNRLNVRTSENIFSVSLPQKQASTYILKNGE